MASNPLDDDAERQAMSDEAAPMLNIASLSRRIYNATIVRRYPVNENPSPALPNCPWKLRLVSGDGTIAESKGPYPSFRYLDLRRQQNESWATSRLEEGVQLAKASKHKEAENCYKEGIDLVPSHTQLMVAYGALCANLGRTQEAISRLERALQIDPAAANAEQYLATIRQQQEQRIQQRQGRHPNRDKTSTLALRTDNALQDAMAESVLAGNGVSKSDGNYPLLADDDDDGNHADDSEDEGRRRRHKKKSKKKKRKKKRRRYDSDSSDTTSSRRRIKKRKKRHERSRDGSDSEDSPRPSRRHDSS